MKFTIGLKKTTSVLALSLTVGLILGGCATDGRKTGSITSSKDKPIAQMTTSELARATQKYGTLYQKNPKSKNIKATAEILMEKYDGEVPSTMDELTASCSTGIIFSSPSWENAE